MVEIEGSGELTNTMVIDYKPTLVGAEIGTLCTSIGDSAFAGSSNLTSATISNSVTSIGTHALAGCRSLTSVTVQAITPPTIGTVIFLYSSNCPIYVPSESVDTYKAASGWSTYASRIQAIPTT